MMVASACSGMQGMSTASSAACHAAVVHVGKIAARRRLSSSGRAWRPTGVLTHGKNPRREATWIKARSSDGRQSFRSLTDFR